ncbi:hypothetical protein [Salinigranum marinum]|uniref:hypothetical protein n=1 Tax=Salinigranum marinum TaxID=1515595 RepID=UPI002989FCB6|nr:hypothetical protein [Salinigranum marinum]
MPIKTVGFPDDFVDLMEEEIEKHDQFDTIDEFVVWASARGLIELVQRAQPIEYPLQGAHISEEERVLRDRIVAIEKSPSRR